MKSIDKSLLCIAAVVFTCSVTPAHATATPSAAFNPTPVPSPRLAPPPTTQQGTVGSDTSRMRPTVGSSGSPGGAGHASGPRR